MEILNLEDDAILFQFAENLKNELNVLGESFNIHNLWKIEGSKELLLDISDGKKYSLSFSAIFEKFCPVLSPLRGINKLMGVDENETNPAYCRQMWRLPMFAALAMEYETELLARDASSTSTPEAALNSKGVLTASKNTVVADSFRTIKVAKLKQLNDDYFAPNLNRLSYFIDDSLSRISPVQAREMVRKLREGVLKYVKITNKSTEQQLQNSFTACFATPIHVFFSEIISRPLSDYQYKTPQKSVLDLMEDFSVRGSITSSLTSSFMSSFMSSFNDSPIPGGYTEDISVGIENGDKRLNGFSIEMKDLKLGVILEKILKAECDTDKVVHFNKLSDIMRQITYYMINEKTNFYFISDFRFCLYLEYPLDCKVEWEKVGDSAVLKDTCPLKYRIIDTMSSSSTITTQALIMVKFFENLCQAGCNTFKGIYMSSFVNEQQRATMGPEGEMTSEFKSFAGKFLLAALKDDKRDQLAKRPQQRKKAKRGSSYGGNISTIQPNDAVAMIPRGAMSSDFSKFPTIPYAYLPLDYKNIKILSQATTRYSVKFLLPMSDLDEDLEWELESSIISTQNHEWIFLKLFDTNHITALIYEVYHGNLNPEWALESDRILLEDIAGDLDSTTRSFGSEINERSCVGYQNELNAHRRILEYNSHIGDERYKINTPRLLQHGYTKMRTDKYHFYAGDYLAFEYLPFADKKPQTARELKNYEQQIENLDRAGILHNDLEERNVCCDDNGKVYILDYGSSRLLN